MSSRMAGAALLRHLGPRLFAPEPVSGLATGRGLVPAEPPAARILPARMCSTAAEAAKEPAATEQHGGSTNKPAPDGQDSKKGIVSYWGIEPRKLMNEDGTEWRWFCFRPWDTYRADTSIDMKKHHEPRGLPDKLAYWMVRSLIVPKVAVG